MSRAIPQLLRNERTDIDQFYRPRTSRPRCSRHWPPKAMRHPPPSRPRPFRSCWRAAICWALPRPAPARPQPSRCPCCERLSQDRAQPAKPRSCRALVLSPTRELASQIDESFRTYGRNLKAHARRGLRRRRRSASRSRSCAAASMSSWRHPAASSISSNAARRHARQGRDLRARRSGPDARSRLHPRHPQDHRHAAARSARTCSSRPPCRRKFPASPTVCSPIRCASKWRPSPPPSSASNQSVIHVDPGQQAQGAGRSARRSTT